MSNDNTTTKTSETRAADLPIAPNGHGHGTGKNTAPDPGRAGRATSSSKKKKKRQLHTGSDVPERAAPTAEATLQAEEEARASTTEVALDAIAEVPDAAADAVAGVPDATPDAVAGVADATPDAIAEVGREQVDEAAPEQIADRLRLRLKVWTDHETGRRYLMSTAFMRDVVDGQPVTDVMYAYAMSEDHTKVVTLRAAEWNALPFFYFQEDGPAPRATARPVDVVP